MAIKTFKRIEKKFLINADQKKNIEKALKEHMFYDAYCPNGDSYWVQNIYYDTPNNSLISHSIKKPSYKAKIRVRHYLGNETYFLEWKQKTLGVVSKRRVALTKDEFENFILKRIKPMKTNYLDKQIIEEFAYAFSNMQILPALYLTYDRVAMFGKNDLEFRATIDNNIRGSRTNFNWDQEEPDIEILPSNLYILELKYNRNFPLWLVKALSENKIYKTSYSKYGEEYKSYILGGK